MMKGCGPEGNLKALYFDHVVVDSGGARGGRKEVSPYVQGGGRKHCLWGIGCGTFKGHEDVGGDYVVTCLAGV